MENSLISWSINVHVAFIAAMSFLTITSCQGNEKIIHQNGEAYDYILQAQYLHELCRTTFPENMKSLDSLYFDSGISALDELMPKKHNRLIELINTKEKKEEMIGMLSKEQLEVLKVQCTQELPKTLSDIKSNLQTMKEQVVQLYKQYESKAK